MLLLCVFCVNHQGFCSISNQYPCNFVAYMCRTPIPALFTNLVGYNPCSRVCGQTDTMFITLFVICPLTILPSCSVAVVLLSCTSPLAVSSCLFAVALFLVLWSSCLLVLLQLSCCRFSLTLLQFPLDLLQTSCYNCRPAVALLPCCSCSLVLLQLLSLSLALLSSCPVTVVLLSFLSCLLKVPSCLLISCSCPVTVVDFQVVHSPSLHLYPCQFSHS